MEKSETIDKLAAAMANFQKEVPQIKMDSEVKVTTRTGGSYTFKYATLNNIVDTVKDTLAKHGLSVSQLIGDKNITTIIMHSSGQWLATTSSIKVSDTATAQEEGSAITYKRRYMYASALGLITDPDDDGNVASGNQAQPTKKAETKQEAKKEPVKPPIVNKPDTKNLNEIKKKNPTLIKEIKDLFRTLPESEKARLLLKLYDPTLTEQGAIEIKEEIQKANVV